MSDFEQVNDHKAVPEYNSTALTGWLLSLQDTFDDVDRMLQWTEDTHLSDSMSRLDEILAKTYPNPPKDEQSEV